MLDHDMLAIGLGLVCGGNLHMPSRVFSHIYFVREVFMAFTYGFVAIYHVVFLVMLGLYGDMSCYTPSSVATGRY